MLMGGASNGPDGNGGGSMMDMFSSLTNLLPDNMFGGSMMGGASPAVPMETANTTDDLD